MDEPTIRAFTLDDATAVCAIVNTNVDHMDEFDPATKAFLRDKNVPERLGPELGAISTLVAERAGRLVGVGARDGDRILRVFVAPDAHGTGIGTALMAALEALGPAAELRLSSSLFALPFYEALGYERGETSVERVGDATFTHVLMRKRVR